jgi:flagellar protein FlaE
MSLESDDYSTWTVAELRDELQTRGIDVPSGSVKADLVFALEDDDAANDEDEDMADDESDDEGEITEESAIVGIHPFGTCVPLSPCPHTEEDAVTPEPEPEPEPESEPEPTDANV